MKLNKRNFLPVVGLLSMMVLAGCGSNSSSTANISGSGELAKVTEFSANLAKGTATFTGVTNATFYTIVAYDSTDYAVTTVNNITNTTNVDLGYDFLAGDYTFVVKALAPHFKSSTSDKFSSTSYNLGAPTVSAKYKTTETGEGEAKVSITNIEITVKPADGDSKTKSWTVKLYKADKTTVLKEWATATNGENGFSATVTAADINVEKITEPGENDPVEYVVGVKANTYDNYIAKDESFTDVTKDSGSHW